MKNNILIIVLVTLVALGVIITVIISSVINNSESLPSDSPDTPDRSEGFSYIEPSSDSISYSLIDNDPSDSQSGSDSSDHTVGNNIVNTARSILERDEKVPFAENGATLEGFDNSGFIYYVLRENGFITCPRELQAQTSMGRRLEYDELKRGDLVFFCNDGDDTSAGYGGIYTGEGTMIACLKPGTYVDETDVSGDYYRKHFFCGVSLS